MNVTFMLGTGTAKGTIIKENEKTVIIQMPDGKTIKRHVEKHNVRMINA